MNSELTRDALTIVNVMLELGSAWHWRDVMLEKIKMTIEMLSSNYCVSVTPSLLRDREITGRLKNRSTINTMHALVTINECINTLLTFIEDCSRAGPPQFKTFCTYWTYNHFTRLVNAIFALYDPLWAIEPKWVSKRRRFEKTNYRTKRRRLEIKSSIESHQRSISQLLGHLQEMYHQGSLTPNQPAGFSAHSKLFLQNEEDCRQYLQNDSPFVFIA